MTDLGRLLAFQVLDGRNGQLARQLSHNHLHNDNDFQSFHAAQPAASAILKQS
jgi:hypothetical protein